MTMSTKISNMGPRGRPRVNGKTMEQMVWLWVRRQATSPTRAAIMDALGLQERQSKSVIDRLTAKGSLVAKLRGITYSAGDDPPPAGTSFRMVWEWLRAQPYPATICECQAHFKFKISTAKSMFRRMREKGTVRQHKADCGRWIFIATDIAPEDMRGSSVGSVSALLAAARSRRNPAKPKRHPFYTPAHALDALWPSPVTQSLME